jgi:hypothetical protein
MSSRPTWDLDRAIDAVDVIPWVGEAWRNHGRRYDATDPGGSRIVSGRYHQAPDQFAGGPCWPALYLSLSNGGAIAELTRRLEPTALAALNNRRLTRLRVSLSRVLDLRDPSVMGLTLDVVVDDYDYSLAQAIGDAVLRRGAEGLLVPAASLVSANLIVLVDNLLPASTIEPLDSIDPKLYVPRT